MSYSLNQKCNDCKKQSTCADGIIIRKAVEAIHSIPSAWVEGKNTCGHQGGGSITHDCTYGFENKNTAAK